MIVLFVLSLLSCTASKPGAEDTGFVFEDARWSQIAGLNGAWCGASRSGAGRCFGTVDSPRCTIPSLEPSGPVVGVSGGWNPLAAYSVGALTSAYHTTEETIVWGRWCIDGADAPEFELYDESGVTRLPPMPPDSFGEWWLYADGDRWVGPQGGCLRAGTEDDFVTDGIGFPDDEAHPTRAPTTAQVRANDFGVCTLDATTVRCAGLTPETTVYPKLDPVNDYEAARFDFVNYARDVAAIDATMGFRFVCVLDAEGHASCETVDDGTDGAWSPPAPEAIAAPDERFTDIEAASNHVCGLQVDGSVTCWGPGADGYDSSIMVGPFLQITPWCGVTVDRRVECWRGELVTAECEEVVDTVVD